MVKIEPGRGGTMTDPVCNCNQLCLHTAAKVANLDGISNLLRNGENIWKKDKGGRTPLHWAVYTGDSDLALNCVKLLLETLVQYSDKSNFVNIQEGQKKTSLDCAASKGHASVIEYFLQNGADVRLIDRDDNSALHTLAGLVNHNKALTCARVIIECVDLLDEKVRCQLINLKETDTTRTAAHLCAIAGNDQLLKYLIQNGADVLDIDVTNSTVLHLAVLNAFAERALKCTQVILTVDQIDMSTKALLLDMKDKFGKGPIHIAARRGNDKVMALLMESGANILVQEDITGCTALHLAASLGDEESASLCVEQLLKNLSEPERQFFVNIKSTDSLTALYLSAKYENVEACKKLLLAGSAFDLSTNRNKTPLEKVYKKIPEAMIVLLDQAVQNSGYTSRLRAIHTYAELDFGPILGYDTTRDNIYKETEELAKIRYANFDKREVILNHLFVRIFIWMKWQEIWWIFFLSRITHISWFILNFLLLVLFYRVVCPFKSSTHFSWHSLRPTSDDHENVTQLSLGECEKSGFLPYGAFLNLFALIIYVLGLIHPTKQRYQWYYKQRKSSRTSIKPLEECLMSFWHYVSIWFKVTPILELCFAMLAMVTTVPIFGILLFPDPVHYAIAGIMGFLSWFFVYLEIGRIPQCGVYINLLKEASKTLGFAIFVHLPILFGFAAVFVLLMQRMPSFSSLSQAIVKVLTLMIGELDYEGLFYGDEKDNLLFAGIEMIAIAIFVLFVAVVVLNFLIGLATDDIKGFRERAKIWKLCAQIEQIVLLESFLDNGLPVGKYLAKQIMLMPPRKNMNQELKQIRRVEISIPDLPKQMQKELHKLKMKTLSK